MAWTDNDLKIFAAGLAIGGKWNHIKGTLPRVKASVVSGTYSNVFDVTLSCDVTEATIIYGLGEETPTTVYTGQTIPIDQEATYILYAYAIYGQSLSPMAKYTWTIWVPKVITSETISLLNLVDACSITTQIPIALNVSETLSLLTPTDGTTTVVPREIISIEITVAPTKTVYAIGEVFDNTGMVVMATYNYGDAEDVSASCTFSPATALTLTDTIVTIAYLYNTTTVETTQAIIVN